MEYECDHPRAVAVAVAVATRSPPSPSSSSSSPLTLRLKLLSMSCCLGPGPGVQSDEDDDDARPVRSTAAWIKMKAHEFPDFRDLCRRRHRRTGSGGFGYDPLSYALNFDGGVEDDSGEELNLRSFSSRLPATPPRPRAAVSR